MWRGRAHNCSDEIDSCQHLQHAAMHSCILPECMFSLFLSPDNSAMDSGSRNSGYGEVLHHHCLGMKVQLRGSSAQQKIWRRQPYDGSTCRIVHSGCELELQMYKMLLPFDECQGSNQAAIYTVSESGWKMRCFYRRHVTQ